MNRLFFFRLIVFSFITGAPSFKCIAQDTIQAMFEKAQSFYDANHLDSALSAYKNICIEYPNNAAYPRALYNVAEIYLESDSLDDAEKVFLEILEKNFDNHNYEKGPGDGIMSEPYAIYNHRACAALSYIYLEKKEYKQALHYLRWSDKKYPYIHFCGNELAANDINLAVMYSKCYDGLGNIDKAIEVLWDHILFNGLAPNEDVISQLKTVLVKKYDEETISKEVKDASNTISEDEKNECAYITIFDHRIRYQNGLMLEMSFEDFNKLTSIEKYQTEYKTSTFYKTFAKN